MDPAALASEYIRVHGAPPVTRHAEYMRRRVAWALQLAAGDGPPWRLMQRALAVRDAMPVAWRDALAVTRVQLLWPHQLVSWASAPRWPPAQRRRQETPFLGGAGDVSRITRA